MREILVAKTLNMVPISKLRRDGDTQQRIKTDPATVSAYAEAMLLGAEFPPAKAFYDGTNFWLVDGFHTAEALLEVGLEEVNCEVKSGTQRDAQWASLSMNRAHGLQRTNEDKRHTVAKALLDPEWSKFSDRFIAAHCGVGHPLVAKMRDQVEAIPPDTKLTVQVESIPPERDPTSVVGRDGKTYKIRPLAPEPAESDPTRQAPEPYAAPAKALAASAPANEPEDDDDGRLTPAEAQAAIDRENERTTDRLIELERLYRADDTKAKLFDMIRMRDNAVNQQAAISARAAALDKNNTFLARQLQRCGKAIGEADMEKVAARVEAFIRLHSKAAA